MTNESAARDPRSLLRGEIASRPRGLRARAMPWVRFALPFACASRTNAPARDPSRRREVCPPRDQRRRRGRQLSRRERVGAASLPARLGDPVLSLRCWKKRFGSSSSQSLV